MSSFDRNPERQLEHVPVDRLFTVKASGKDRQRPELERLLAFAREGDTVVVHSMDRLFLYQVERERIHLRRKSGHANPELQTRAGRNDPTAN